MLSQLSARLAKFLWIFAAFSMPTFQISRSEEVSTKGNPEIFNVRCEVKDLEATIIWNTNNHTDDSLLLKRYIVRFCLLTECRRKEKLHCYEDDARTKKLRKLQNTSCRASVSQLIAWNYYTFEITATYNNLSSDSSVKITNSTNCDSITRLTSLSAPSISTQSTKTSVTIMLNLEEKLQKTMQILNNTMHRKNYGGQPYISQSDVVYHYSLTPRAGGTYRSNGLIITPGKSSWNNFTTYVNLAPGEEYDIQGWYTMEKLRNDKSEVASAIERTKPDRFPQWAQVTVIIAASLSVIIAMVTGISCNEYRKRRKEIKEGTLRPTLNFELYLNDICNAAPSLSFELSDDYEGIAVPPLLIKPEHSLDMVPGNGVAIVSCPRFEASERPAAKVRNASDSSIQTVTSSGDYDIKSLQDYSKVVERPK